MRKLIEKLAKAEKKIVNTQFLAPRVRGSKVRVKLQGLVNTYEPTPTDFEGWGVFKTQADFTAKLEHQAPKRQVAQYLELLNLVRVILVRPLRHQTWLAYPVNAQVFRQKFGPVKPITVHLVTLGRAFEQAIVRFDGAAYWFDRIDRRGNPRIPAFMAKALKDFVSPEELKFPSLTPELREAYKLVFKPAAQLRVRCSEDRLRRALEMGGGQLEGFVDRGDYWNTSWKTSDGAYHTSAIQKSDLTVLSAGICLDGEDQKFDLQSLVGVVENANYD